MDIELHAAIAAVIPHCYGTVAPADAPEPYVIWQRIGGEFSEYLDNDTSQVDTATVQVRVFSRDILQPKALIAQLCEALRQHPEMVIRPQGGYMDDYDHDMGLFVAEMMFDVGY